MQNLDGKKNCENTKGVIKSHKSKKGIQCNAKEKHQTKGQTMIYKLLQKKLNIE